MATAFRRGKEEVPAPANAGVAQSLLRHRTISREDVEFYSTEFGITEARFVRLQRRLVEKSTRG